MMFLSEREISCNYNCCLYILPAVLITSSCVSLATREHDTLSHVSVGEQQRLVYF